MKKVYCVYKLGENSQEDDVELQEKACRNFANEKGWIIEKELYRDDCIVTPRQENVIPILRESAQKKEFDVLLAYEFDKLCIIKEEVHLLVEWFVNQGIEVWSVREGQQRFEDEADRLSKYIKFWQTSNNV